MNKKYLIIINLFVVTILVLVMLFLTFNKKDENFLVYGSYKINYDGSELILIDGFCSGKIGLASKNEDLEIPVVPISYVTAETDLVIGDEIKHQAPLGIVSSVNLRMNELNVQGQYYQFTTAYTSGFNRIGKTAETYAICFNDLCFGTNNCGVGDCDKFNLEGFKKYSSLISVEAATEEDKERFENRKEKICDK